MFQKKLEKIYVLSGKARSGKDTVAQLIEEFYQDKKVIKLSYSYYLKDYLKRMNLYDEKEKPRSLMQEFGNDLLRKKIHPLFLINRLLEDIEVFSYFYDIIIVTDARLKEEIEMPKKTYDNVSTIRIIRENFDNGLTEEQKEDITETDLDDYQNFDYVIKNDQYLKERLEEYLHE
jgi:hypothetical protein